MKIAINGRLLGNHLEGIGHFTVEVVQRMALNHHDDDFVILTDRKIAISLFQLPNISYYRTGLPTRHPILWNIWLEHFVPKALRKIGADVFFSPEGLLSLHTKVPTLMTIHDLAYLHFPKGSMPSHRNYLSKRMTSFVDRANKIACVSEFTKQDLVQHFSQCEHKIIVCKNGLRAEFRPSSEADIVETRMKVSDGSPYLLYLGSIHPRKNIIRLIQAFERAKESIPNNPKLVLAGRMAWKSREISEYMRMHQRKGHLIHLTDFDDYLPNLVGAASCICYISLFEGFGLPVLEGMGSGVPVLTSRNSAMEEVADSAALYVNPSNVNSIADGIVKIMTHQKLRKQMIETGLERAATFSWEESAERIYATLVDIQR